MQQTRSFEIRHNERFFGKIIKEICSVFPYRRTVCFSIVLLTAAYLSLCGCFGIPAEPYVAATVNGDKIYEADVTAYIEGFRSKNESYASDSGWNQYLIGAGKTSETFRRYVLDTVFIPNLIIEQQCLQHNIVVTDAQLDEIIDKERVYYELSYGKDSWDSVLYSYGYNEESWREKEELRLLSERLKSQVVKTPDPTRSQVQVVANEHASDYNGKHSYFRVYSDLDAAKRARRKIKLSSNGNITLKKFKSLKSVKNAGWNSIDADLDKMSSEYTNALNELGRGLVSQPVESDGLYYLIYCDKVFHVDKNKKSVDLASVPNEIYKQLRSYTVEMLVDKSFDKWLTQVEKRSTISYAAMPSGLPYDVDITTD